ncbi:MAG: succinate dehydrogenase/fumarate reductase iron-sulfur subunit [Planctomycetes bacterium]|nr:succinate dehydrogenase/fumarate reductase iron-sulfur subunit [Planctomycetota bacterium]
MRITLKIWRQEGPNRPGKVETHFLPDVSPHMSFLEMLDVLNERLIASGLDTVAFDHDCREGICGACSLVIDGRAHGPEALTTACQLHMRHYSDGDTIHVEPFRANAFPVLKDLMVDRSAFDRIISAGGFVSSPTGSAPDGNAILVPKPDADRAMDAAACIGCGACAAACPNASAMLFVAAKVAHLALLPQGQPERERRALAMVHAMDEEGFGSCTNHFECMAACPKGISVESIARMNRDFALSFLKEAPDLPTGSSVG